MDGKGTEPVRRFSNDVTCFLSTRYFGVSGVRLGCGAGAGVGAGFVNRVGR